MAMKKWVKNISRKSIERKHTSTSMKHVNQPVVNAPKKISLNLQITMKTLLLRIMKKYMKNEDLKREKKPENF